MSSTNITGYNIYAAGDTGPYFTHIATVPVGTLSLDTSDAWSKDASTPTKTYAVTAVRSDGSESFFSDGA